uniref:Uncharacterized protein n=1 Tax=Salix viminalis TaxID=40686 RepID=A0A6N2MY34_SALVM
MSMFRTFFSSVISTHLGLEDQIFPGSIRYEARLMEAVHDEAATILLPQTPEKLRELMGLSLVKLAKGVPSFFLTDVIDVM